jgi:hypothetical protein
MSSLSQANSFFVVEILGDAGDLLKPKAGLPDFLTQYTKNWVKCTKFAAKLPNVHKMYQMSVDNIFQMAIEYTNFFHSNAVPNCPNRDFVFEKCMYSIWQPWPKVFLLCLSQ